MTKIRAFAANIPLLSTSYRCARATTRFARYLSDYRRFRSMLNGIGSARFPLLWRDRYPCLDDRTGATGFDPHYIYHPAWAARILARTRPAYHVDISSLLAFATIASAFVPIKFYDYRPAAIRLKNYESFPGDLMRLPFEDGSVPSLSCMHVVEHIGLGRYGDPLDPDGDLKAMAELMRVLAPGGQLLFVTPVGRPRIQYNAHRIYSYQQIVDAFSPLTLEEFALVPDDGEKGLIENAAPELVAEQKYGCGCFRLVRPS